MKKLLVLLCCSFILVAVQAQKAKEVIPVAAKTAFAAKFPAAQKIKWSVEKPGAYEVEFTLNKVESSALFDETGKIVEIETEISVGELPQAAKAILTKNFAGYKLDEIEKSTDSKGVVSYEMEASKGKVKLELCFDANGKVLSQEPLKKDKD